MKYIPQSEQTKESYSEPKTIKNDSFSCKKDKNSSQNNKELIKNVAWGGFSFLKEN